MVEISSVFDRLHRPNKNVQRIGAIAAALLTAIVQPALAAGPADLLKTFAEEPAAAIDHGDWDRLLKTYVKPDAGGLNRVDYAGFKSAGQAALKTYIARLENTDPGTLGRGEQFALLANLYNAKTIDIVLDKYPVKSIKDISLGGGVVASITGGPWKAKVLKIKGVALSLDDIEHAILRPTFKDPRIHYAVNCASVGCPNLLPEAFTGAKLEAQLDAAANAYINHPRGVSAGSGVKVSSIYHWYKIDFGNNDAGVLSHLVKYAGPELAAKLKGKVAIDGHGYDWSLNDIAR